MPRFSLHPLFLFLFGAAALKMLGLFRSVHRCQAAATPTQLVGNSIWPGALMDFIWGMMGQREGYMQFYSQKHFKRIEIILAFNG